MGGLNSSAADVSASLKNTGVQGAKAMTDISSSAGKTLQDIKNVGLQGTIALEQTVKAAEQASAAARKAGDSVSSIQKPAKVPVSIGGDAATKLQGISPNTVKKHISKALATLRERMKHTNIEN